MNIPKKEAPNALDLLDRNKCFAMVASAVKDVVSDSVVDLKSPEVRTPFPSHGLISVRILLWHAISVCSNY